MSTCIFCSITNKEIPAQIIYEDEDIIAFNDINPKAPIHFLVVPKVHLASLLDSNDSHIPLLGRLMFTANKIAIAQNLRGYKVHINTGVDGGQEVFHLHLHVLGQI